MGLNNMAPTGKGKVYLVGAGPGDPGLFTLRGKQLMESADVVVYDSLVNDALLKFAPQAEQIFVGKRAGMHSLVQDDINRILVEHASAGRSVVRLKGGDPTVFGRISEELNALNAAKLAYEIVPGVTAGVAGPAYAGIPVTDRTRSSSVTFITGREALESKTTACLPVGGTIVIYMGMKSMGEMVARLLEAGHPKTTPVAVIQWATRSHQRTVTGTLKSITELCSAEDIGSPSVIVVGEVVTLRESFSWFEDKPLFGRKICVTRAAVHASDLVQQLQEYGADIMEFPTVAVESTPPTNDEINWQNFDWILFTSINGVDALFDRLHASGNDLRALHGLKLFCISQKTAEALAQRGLIVDGIPDHYEPESIVAQLESLSGPLTGQRLAFPRADVGRSALPQALRDAGAKVTELQAYQMVIPDEANTRADRLVEFAPDYIIFNSASAGRNFHAIMGQQRLNSLAKTARYASIGPVASAAARDCGIEISIEPRTHRIPELIEALIEYNRTHSLT